MRALLLSALLAWPAAAQERPLDPEILLDRLIGRTIAFAKPGGELVGHERFLTRDRTLWRGADGFCAEGAVSVEGGAICFRYDGPPHVAHCWLPFEDGSATGYRSTASQEVQMIQGAPRASVECEAEPLS